MARVKDKFGRCHFSFYSLEDPKEAAADGVKAGAGDECRQHPNRSCYPRDGRSLQRLWVGVDATGRWQVATLSHARNELSAHADRAAARSGGPRDRAHAYHARQRGRRRDDLVALVAVTAHLRRGEGGTGGEGHF